MDQKSTVENRQVENSQVENREFQVGDIVEWRENQHRIVADDSKSTPHPGGYKKFDYILQSLHYPNSPGIALTKNQMKEVKLIEPTPIVIAE